MAGLKASTEEKLIREKERNIFYFNRKAQEYHMGYRTTSHFALFHCRWALSRACNGPNDSQILRRGDLGRVLGGDTWCVK